MFRLVLAPRIELNALRVRINVRLLTSTRRRVFREPFQTECPRVRHAVHRRV